MLAEVRERMSLSFILYEERSSAADMLGSQLSKAVKALLCKSVDLRSNECVTPQTNLVFFFPQEGENHFEIHCKCQTEQVALCKPLSLRRFASKLPAPPP